MALALPAIVLALIARPIVVRTLLYPSWQMRERSVHPGFHIHRHDVGDGFAAGFASSPAKPTRDDDLLVVFSGNAQDVRSWSHVFASLPVSERHRMGDVLFIIYPGYQGTAGIPSKQTILDATQAAIRFAQNRRALPYRRVNLLGYSLGGAAALHYAASARDIPIGHILCISTFSRLRDVVSQLTGGWVPSWLAHILLGDENWDNVDAAEFPRHGCTPASFTVFHGSRDALIPSEMAFRLPNATVHLVEGATHNDVLTYPIVNAAIVQIATNSRPRQSEL